MRFKGLYAVLTSLFIFSSVFSQNTEVKYKQGQINIKLTPRALAGLDRNLLAQGRTGLGALDSLNARFGATLLNRLFPYFKIKTHNGLPVTLDAWYTVHFSQAIDEPAVALAYADLSETIYAEACPISKIYATPNDPQYSNQWHLNQTNDADIDAPEAWDLWTGNTSIIVAMMDTGVKWWHTDLAGALASESNHSTIRGNMWINTAELNGTASVDDDGNGKVDDWVGWDFVDNITPAIDSGDDYDEEDNNPSDVQGHGTHCAGNIAAINNNGATCSSAAGGWGEDGSGNGNGVKIMALRIGYSDFYGLMGYIDPNARDNAFIYAADNGAKIASCSWGSAQTSSLVDATNYFLYNTTSPGGNDPQLRLIFKASGNDSQDLGSSSGDYLIDREEVVTVSATEENDNTASFSNYGEVVDISAPGDNIVSTSINSNGYETMGGTSMATPIAASVAALVWSYNNLLTPVNVKTILFESADALSASGMGAGRINAYGAMTHPDISLPVELSSFTATSTAHSILLQWQTQSELENMGFNILRKTENQQTYRMIASFKTNPSLNGLGNSAFGKEYVYEDKNVESGLIYSYLLEDVDYAGNIQQHGPLSVCFETPIPASDYILLNNYPNPFNSSTTIQLTITDTPRSASPASLSLFDSRGQKIKTLFRGVPDEDSYAFRWDGKNSRGLEAGSGIYFCLFKWGGKVLSRKIVLVR